MVKVFVGNIPSDCARVDIIDLFEKYGKVKDCDIIRNFAFIHYDTHEEAKEAIDALNKSTFMGNEITVEESTSRPRNTHKIYVGNISSSGSRRELQKIFEDYGDVTSCDIIKDFAFVHMANEKDAEKAVKELDGMSFAGRKCQVEFARNDRRNNRFGPPDRAYRDYYDRWYDYYYGRGGGRGYRGGHGGYNNYYRPNYGGYGGGGGYSRRRSPVRRRRHSRSRSRSRSDSRSRSRSRTPKKDRKSSSRSRSPKNDRSRSRSPKNNRSRSRTPKNDRSRSRTPKKDRSRSRTPKKDRKSSSRSKSPQNDRKSSSRSRSRSNSQGRRSESPEDNKSD